MLHDFEPMFYELKPLFHDFKPMFYELKPLFNADESLFFTIILFLSSIFVEKESGSTEGVVN